MNGKILKISGNDLYVNVDERKVVVFAVFIHKKYMNKYAIFAFENEFAKKKLFLASVHLKENSLVTFNIRPDEEEYIDKVELVSYKEKDYDNLDELDKLSIKREIINNDTPKKSYGFLYFILILLILLLGGITYLYFNPDFLKVELKELNCTSKEFDKKLSLNFVSEAKLRFNRHDELVTYHKIDTYKFNDEDAYLKFKFDNDESKYFDLDGAYKYDDDKLELKLIYDDKLIIYKYDEVLKYLKNNGYTCQEGTYYE